MSRYSEKLRWFQWILGINAYIGIISSSYLIWITLDYIPKWKMWGGKYVILLFITIGMFILIEWCEKMSNKYRNK